MPPSTDEELDRFVTSFESGTLPKPQWTHAAHLAIGAHYAMAWDDAQAMNRLRDGICKLNTCHGVVNSDSSGYHETITRFWLSVIREFLRRRAAESPGSSRADSVAAVVSAFQERRALFREHWTFDIVTSAEARRRWIEPDA